MSPQSIPRKTGSSYHRSGIETVHEIGWRGLMQSTVLSEHKGKPGRKPANNRSKVRHMDLASRRDDWLATRRRVLQGQLLVF